MTVFAYLRVSTNTQDIENQKFGVQMYAEHKGFVDVIYYEDPGISGHKKEWQERGLGRLFLNAGTGDILLIPEISRIGRTVLQVLGFLEACSRKKISVHIVKGEMIMDGSMSSRLLAMVLGFASEIERELISARTKESIEKRRALGLPIGRPKGTYGKSKKLEAHADEIRRWLRMGIDKSTIARLLECSMGTLYHYIEHNGLGEYVKTRNKPTETETEGEIL